MDIVIAATKTCHFRPLLEKELKDVGLEYSVKYFSDHPEIIKKHKLKTSPLLIVDGKLVSVGMPKHGKVKELAKQQLKLK